MRIRTLFTAMTTSQSGLRCAYRLGLGLCLSACDPAVFSHAVSDEEAGQRDAGKDTSETMLDAGPASAQPTAGRGGAGRHSAGAGGTGARAGSTSAGPGDARGVQAGSAAGTAAVGGTAAGSGNTPSGAAGTAMDAGAPCPPADLGKVSVSKLRDDLLAVPETSAGLEVSNGPAVLAQDRLFWTLGTQSDGPLQGAHIGAWISAASLHSDKPALSIVTAPLLPDEPEGSQPTTIWPVEPAAGQAVSDAELFFTRYFILAPLGAGLGRVELANPAPAKVLVAADKLFPAPPAADGGMAQARRPLLLSAAQRVDEYIYAYVCNGTQSGDVPDACRLARVLATQAQNGASYEYWSHGQWLSDLQQASVVIDHVPSALSVRHNAYLDRYLAVYSGSNNDIQLAWSDKLEGPFQPLGAAVETVHGSGGSLPLSNGAMELPVAHATCDPELIIAYSVPLDDKTADGTSRVRLETHVMHLALH